MSRIAEILKDKQAQVRILDAILQQLCKCECEHSYVEKVRNQLNKEIDDIRNLKN